MLMKAVLVLLVVGILIAQEKPGSQVKVVTVCELLADLKPVLQQRRRDCRFGWSPLLA
jgi:hypothetical protein